MYEELVSSVLANDGVVAVQARVSQSEVRDDMLSLSRALKKEAPIIHATEALRECGAAWVVWK